MPQPFHLRGTDEPDRMRRVRAALEGANYSEERVTRDLGPASQARAGSDLVARGRLRNASDGAAPLIRLFQQHEALSPDELEAVVAVADLAGLGLVDVDPETESVLATVNLTPVRELWIASDWPSTLPPVMPGEAPAEQRLDEPDHVMGIGASTTSLLGLMIPPPAGGSLLDLGTGSGALALAGAAPDVHVTATDLNPRALRFVRWNAAFNDRTIDPREGSLFEPVVDETFDRVVCNPPYVVSPDHEFLYRDGGDEGDGICARILRESPDRLRPGGIAQVLCNWPIRSGEDPTSTPRGWVEGLGADGFGVDAVVLAALATPVEIYAAQWMDTMAHPSAAARVERYHRWLDHYRQRGIASIGHGLINLKRRDEGPTFFHELTTGAGFGAGAADDLAAIFDHHRFLLEASDAELLATRFQLAAGLERRDRHPLTDPSQRKTTLVRRTGILQSSEVDPALADLLVRIDGQTLGGIADTIATAAGGTRGLLAAVRESVRRGYLQPV